MVFWTISQCWTELSLLMVLIGPNTVGQMHPKTIAAFTVILFRNQMFLLSADARSETASNFCLKVCLSNTSQNQKAVRWYWLAGFTELFNWFLSLNSTDPQLPMWKGWIFLLEDDTGAKQQASVVLGGKNMLQRKHHIHILSFELDKRGCHVEEMLRRINFQSLCLRVSQWWWDRSTV